MVMIHACLGGKFLVGIGTASTKGVFSGVAMK